MLNFTGNGFGLLSVFARMQLACALLLFASLATAATNNVPVISGKAATSVAVGAKYYFKPTATDADRLDKLTFAVMNKPSWITFSSVNGSLTGYPKSTQVGSYNNIVVSVSDGKVRRSLAAFSIRVTATGTSSNSAPRISGTPLKSTPAGASYRFQPTASDANGDKLTFSITNKPVWAGFSTTSGLFWGTPSASYVGTTSNIVIRVSDGKTSAALPAFAVTVTRTANGEATVSWLPPTRNIDGSALTNLAGHRIHYGTTRTTLSQTITVTNIGLTRYVVENLPPGTWYFGVQAYNRSGQESAISALASKTIR